MELAFFLGGWGVRTSKPLNRLTKNLAWVIMSAITPSMPKLKTIAPYWGCGGVCVKYHPRVVFSTRCNIYISRLCYDVSVRLSVRLSVTKVHWRIIANLGFKFTAHCGRGGVVIYKTTISRQWRNKVAVGPRASIPKGPPLPPKNCKKTASGKFWAPHSAGPACTARLARPIVTPLYLALC